MKFTDGYWLPREEFIPAYAVEYSHHRVSGNTLEVFAPTKHIASRGDTLNLPVLTVSLSSPMPGVIRVVLEHFRGAVRRTPSFEVREEQVSPQIQDTPEAVLFQTGDLCARIDKTPNAWEIRFEHGGKRLTDTGFRNMGYWKHRQSGEGFLAEQLALGVGETIYGLGEQFTPFVKNGQSVEMWNGDGGTASEQAYKCVPFYLSSAGYGVFVAQPEDVAFEVGSEKVERVQFSTKGERLEYYLIDGPTPKEVLSRYTALTGRPALPPEWSFGLWLTTSFTTSYDEDTVTSMIDGMAQRNIPLSVFHFDCFWMKKYQWCDFIWDDETFPDPREMLERYHQRGLKICVWINPYIGQNSCLFEEGMKNGYLLRKENGDVWQTDMWQAGMGIVDFTNTQATAWYQSKLEELLEMGVDCFKTDFGEKIPVKGIVYHDGSDPVRMHNYYTYLYNQAVFQVLQRRRGDGQAVLFARSATAGSQQFPVHWGGDSTASFPSMAESLRGGLSLSLCGFGFWSHDMGGFENTATADVYKRWCAFGMLSSHSRLHGSTSYRVPWLFDEEACRVLEQFTRLKCRLMPYLYAKAVQAHETGLPMMRPMVLEFPEDLACRPLDLQYMLGDALLVAPVMREDGTADTYLPKGTWTHLLTGEIQQGGQFHHGEYDYFSLPLYVRENTILVLGQRDDRPDYDYAQGFTAHIYEPQEGAVLTADIPDEHGGCAVRLRAERKGDLVTVSAQGAAKDWKVCVHLGGRNWEAQAVSNRAEIALN